MARVASLKTWLDRFESDERCSPRIGVTAAERQKTGETLCERVTLLWTSSTRMQRCHRFFVCLYRRGAPGQCGRACRLECYYRGQQYLATTPSTMFRAKRLL